MRRYLIFMVLLCIASLLIGPVVSAASPEAVECVYKCGRALDAVNANYEDAIEVIDFAIKLDPGYTAAYTVKGSALLNLERYDEALEAYVTATELDPTKVIAWSGKGDALFGLERYDEALEAYDKALALDPEHYLSQFGKAETLYALGRDDEVSNYGQYITGNR